MFRQFLHDGWSVRAVGDLGEAPDNVRGRDIPAAVPGCVHTDLLAAGLIEDPYLDRNESAVQWIGLSDWQYACTFDLDAALGGHERVELVCEGLDTVATVELNGQVVGSAANMHHPHRFDAAGALRGGGNELVVTFASAVRYAEQMRDRLGARPWSFEHPFNFIRKMACNFGWDWGPTLVTAGIWKPIYLLAWSGARIASVRPLVARADAERAVVRVHVDAARAGGGALDAIAELTGPDGRRFAGAATIADGQDSGILELTVPHPHLWWPHGQGDQPLYDLAVTLSPAGADRTLDAWTGRIGLRTVRLNTEPDEIGSQFTLEVNGRAVFCKGANWIPDDCFPTRIGPDRYRRRVRQARDANMNMLRVWGGGMYESDDFYDACDALGVMVWQDFLFACAAYPEEPPFDALVEAEARHQITRLSRHPSLVLWDGNNENIWFYFMRDWKTELAGTTWGGGFYFDLLPRLVAELDPTRPYWPGSPYSGSMDIDPIDDRHGNMHIWDVCNRKHHSAYREHRPRFASEFGKQGPPTFPTLARSIPPDQRRADSPAMLHHQKASSGQDIITTRLAEDFEIPGDFDDWAYLMQLNQARGVACGVEWLRALRPRCMGTLYWQLNDCWPVTSWAAIDGDGRPKPLWYATRRFYADRLLTIQPADDGLALVAVNDTLHEWRAEARVARITFDGRRLAEETFAFRAAPGEARRVAILAADLARPDDPHRQFIAADAGDGARAEWFFRPDKELDYPAPAPAGQVVRDGHVQILTIATDVLLRDVAVFPERLDAAAVVDDQLVTVWPGQSVSFKVDCGRELTAAELTCPPVFQCANRFGRRRG